MYIYLRMRTIFQMSLQFFVVRWTPFGSNVNVNASSRLSARHLFRPSKRSLFLSALASLLSTDPIQESGGGERDEEKHVSAAAIRFGVFFLSFYSSDMDFLGSNEFIECFSWNICLPKKKEIGGTAQLLPHSCLCVLINWFRFSPYSIYM